MTAEEREIDRLKKIIRNEAADWAETDTTCRELAAKVLPRATVDGNSNHVPDLEELFATLVVQLKGTNHEGC